MEEPERRHGRRYEETDGKLENLGKTISPRSQKKWIEQIRALEELSWNRVYIENDYK